VAGAAPVLILTQPVDPTADYVIAELRRRRVPLVRLDPGDFPEQVVLSATLEEASHWSGTIRDQHREVQLSRVRSVYYRRPSSFRLHLDMSGPERRWATLQARFGLGGLLASLPRWLNHPERIAHASFKPIQLQMARGCGLRVPPTLITNDPAEAARFANHHERVIYKPLAAGGVAEAGTNRLLYCAVVDPADLPDPSVRRTAHLFQAWVDKDYEVRLTVVDGECFAAAIHAGSALAGLDWRADYDHLDYTVVTPPEAVRTRAYRLLRMLGLRFGAFDFIVDADGRWVFLEVNPNGQWAWIEERTGLPIAAAIATALERGVTA
jgi:ATP-grasp ribosomal peptide maturase